MSNVTVQPVQSKKARKAFLQLPWKMHSSDPNWIPPIRHNQKELVNYRKHPFYDNAEIETFLATKDGEVVGRIAAIIDHGHNEYYKEKRGMIGFFESINDTEVSRKLFEAARQWHESKGMEALRGPVNPSMNYECGLLVEGFETPPSFMMTYNPDFYARLWEDFGFEKAQDLFAYDADTSMLDSIDPKIVFVLEEAARRFNVEVREVDKKDFKKDIYAFLDIYNKAMNGNWGYVPMTPGEVEHTAAALEFLIVPQLSIFAHVDDKPVGVVFGLLDYNPIIKKIDGRMFPFGFLRILWGRKKIKKIRLISTTVLPEYQRWGLGVTLLGRLFPRGIEWGLTECELSWVLESNQLSRGTIERGGAKKTKVYRIYDFDIQSST